MNVKLACMILCRSVSLSVCITILHIALLFLMRFLAQHFPYLSTGGSFVDTSLLALILVVNITCTPLDPPPSHYQPICAQNSNTLRNRIQKLYIHTLTLATTVWLHFIISYFVHRELHRMGVDLVALYSTEMTTFSFNNI